MPGRARLVLAVAAVVLLAGACNSAGAESDADATISGVAILTPEHGSTVERPVTVTIDGGNIDVTGGTVPADAGGAFHLWVDTGCVDLGDPVLPDADGHHAFEPGDTSITVDLEPGVHDLCVQFANVFGVAFYATDTVTVRVTG